MKAPRLLHFSPARAAALALTLLAAPEIHAVTYYWDTNNSTAGFGTAGGTWAAPTTNDATQGWSTSATGVNVMSGTTNTTTADALNFGTATDGLAAGTITVSGNVSSGAITFGTASGNITLSGGNISLAGSIASANTTQTHTITSNITRAASDISFSGGSKLTFNGVISGANALATDSGNSNGPITFNGNNTYTGNFSLGRGWVDFNSIANAGQSSALGAGSMITLAWGGGQGPNLNYTGATAASTNRTFKLDGGNNALIAQSGALVITGNVTGTASYASSLTLSGIANTGSNEISGVIGGNITALTVGAITPNGGTSEAGYWILSGNNSYTGTTWITGSSILRIAHANALGTTANGTSVASGSALELTGGISVGAEALSLSSTGISSGGGLRNISGNNSYAGVITLGGAARINSDANTLTLSGGITGTQNLTIGGASNTIISGNITTSTGTLTKDGTGILTLSGNNTYTGTTTVSAGTLEIGATGRLGAGSYAGSISNNGTLIYSGTNAQTLSGVISGTGALTQNAASTLTLSNTNTYSGGTTISLGTLNVTNSSALGSGNVSVAAGGKLEVGANNLTIANNITLNGTTTNGAIFSNQPGAGVTTNLTGQITLNATSNVSNVWNDKTLQLSGKITGVGGLDFVLQPSSIGGRYLITGATNDYAGATSVTGSETAQFGYTGQAMLYLGATNALPTTTALTLNYADLYLNGQAQTLASISGSGNFSVQNGSATAATLTLGSGNTTSNFSGTIKDNGISVSNTSSSPATVTGTVALTKIGTGTLTLSGNNTYTGATTISAGTLKAGSATGISSASTLNATGGVFDLNGYNATVAAVGVGNAAGTITNSASGSGTNTLTITNYNVNLASLITDGATAKTAVTIYNNGGANALSNANNTFSGGLTIANGGSNARLYQGSVTNTLVNGTLTKSNLGTGTVYIGANGSTAAAQLMLNSGLVYNNIVVNAGATYVDGGRAAFRIDGSGIQLYGTLTAGASDISLSNGSGTGSATAYGQLTGTNGLLLNPSQGTAFTLTLTNNSLVNTNNYSGNTTISANTTLALGAANQIANGAGKGNLIINSGTFNMAGFSETINGLSGNGTIDGNGATLNVGDNNATSTFSGVIKNTAGTLALTKIGNGTLSLSGTNAYSGGTTVNAGTLSLNVGSGISGALVMNNGTTVLGNAHNAFNALTSITMNGSTLSSTSTGYLLGGFNGALTMVDSTITGNPGDFAAASYTLSGNNTISGPTITQGSGNFNVTSGTTTISSVLAYNLAGPTNGSLQKSGAGMLILSGNNTSSANVTISAGTLEIGAAGRLMTGNYNGTISNSAAFIYSGTNAQTLSGVISGTGAITQNGTGMLTLSNAANTYNGSTTINAGTLAVSGNISSSALTINSGGVVSAGSTAAVAKFNAASLTVAGDSGYAFTIGNISGGTAGTAGTDYDQITTTGAITFNNTAANPFTVYINGTPTNWSSSGSYTWNILSGSSLSGFSSGNFVADYSSFGGALASGASWTFGASGGNLTLTYGTAGTPTWAGGTGVWSGNFTPSMSNNLDMLFTGAGGTATNDIASGTLSSVGTITFNSTAGSYTLAANSGSAGNGSTLNVSGSIVNNSANAQAINNALALNGVRAINTASGNITLGGAISGAGGISKSGSSTLTLSGNNTYTGSTTISAGTLQIGGAGLLGGGNYSNTISNSGTLLYTSTANQTLSGVISGTGALTQNAASTLTLSGNNTYTGATTINAGTLLIGAAGSLGGGNYTGNISNSGLLIHSGTNNQTLSGVISGAGAVTKNAAGTLTLSGNNTYAGGTTLTTGTIQVTSAAGLGTGNLTAALNTKLLIAPGGGNMTIANNMSFGGGSVNLETGAGNTTLTGLLTYTGGIHHAGGGTLMINGRITSANNSGLAFGGQAIVNSTISIGTGDMYLSGLTTRINSSGNTFGNIILYFGGNLTLGTTNAIASSSKIRFGWAAAGQSTATLNLNGYDQTVASLEGALGNYDTQNISITGGGVLTVNQTAAQAYAYGGRITDGVTATSLTKNGSGTLMLQNWSGINSTYSGATTINAGTLMILAGNGTSLSSNSAYTVASGAVLSVNGTSQGIGSLAGAGTVQNGHASTATTLTMGADNSSTTFSGTIQNGGAAALAITKNGTGTLTLAGTNTYTGATTVNGGTLQLSSNITSSALTLGTGSTISLGNTTASAKYNAASITVQGGSGYAFTIGNVNASVAGTDYDQLASAGALTLNNTAANPFTITLHGTPTGWSNTGNYSWNLISAASQTGFNSGNFAVNLTNFGITSGNRTGTWTFTNPSGGNITLTYAAATPDYIWSGTTGDWSTGFTPTAPTTDKNLVFTGAGGTATNNIGNGTLSSLNFITFNSTASSYTLAANAGSAGASGGTALTVKGDIINNSASAQTINMALALGASSSGIIDTAAGNITIGGVISGTGVVTKNGNSTLTLSAANTYTGATAINGGTLSLTGNLSGGTAITTAGSSAFTQGAASIISGTASLTQNSSGSTTLAGANTYNGSTTLRAGTLNINNATAIGTGTLTIAGGTIDNTTGSAITLSTNNVQNWNGNFTFTGTKDLNLGTGAVTMNSSRTITVNAGNLTVRGVVSGAGFGLTKNGSGTLILNASTAFTGAKTVNAGTLRLEAQGNFIIYGANSTININNGSTLQLGFQSGFANIPTLQGMIINIDSTGGATIVNDGLNALIQSGNWMTINTNGGAQNQLTSANNGFYNDQGTNGGLIFNVASGSNSTADMVMAAVAGSYAITKNGTGKVLVTASPTLRGITINNGVLEFGGSSTPTFSSTLAFTNNGTFSWNSTASVTNSQNMTGTGNLTKSNTSTLTLSGNNTYTGLTTINAGTLAIGNNMTIGAIAGTGGNLSLGTGFTLTTNTSTNTTISSVVQGSGNLAKSGTGTLTLSCSNTYSGGTTLNTGTLVIGNAAAAGTGTITQTNGTSLLKLDTTGT
ncbi:MAG: autotransporter-associated beta strand repeat-containing protein, partial [Verrucomicrobia bacterium]|nr:autotransporter-associated beta strand repeat-containing protein [Verrucomicrobiota bacterium]